MGCCSLVLARVVIFIYPFLALKNVVFGTIIMADAGSDGGLLEIARLIDELKHEDVALRTSSMRRLLDISKALGPGRTRDELLPFLQESIDDEDDVLLILASKLGKMVDSVGGPDFSVCLLAPLEKLAMVEEPAVREKTIESMYTIARGLSESHLGEHFVPLVRRLATRDWFTSRISACALFEVAYARLSGATKAEFRGIFGVLCRDDTPMVRRASATNLGKFAQVVELEHVKSELLPLFTVLVADEQDSVRLLAVQNAVVMGKILGQDAKNSILPVILSLSEDKSWRVRWSVSNSFCEVCDSLGEDITRNELVRYFVKLLRDSEPEVRTASAFKVTDVAKRLTPEMSLDYFLGPLRELVVDQNLHVRAALASVIMGMGPVLQRERTIEHLLPLFLQLLKDESSEVRLNLISRLADLNKVIGIDLLTQSLLPAITELADDKQWRVRLAIIEHIPVLASELGMGFFEEKLSVLCMTWLGDKVFSIREAAAANLKNLSGIFGQEFTKSKIIPRIKDLYNNSNYLCRLNAIRGIELLAEVLEDSVVRDQVVPLLIKMSKDPVPNVRFNVAKCAQSIKATFPSVSLPVVASCLKELAKDNDIDVQYFANEALSALSANA